MRTIVVYGNCQAEHILAILRWLPEATEKFRITYFSSFLRPPGSEVSEATPQDFAECALLIGHPNNKIRPYDPTWIPSDCLTVTFSPTDFLLLWPFVTRNNIYNRPDRENPYGSFPYGDRIVLDILADGVPEEEALAEYRARSAASVPDLARMLELERFRLLRRDQQCDVKMGEFITEHFFDRPLFWTFNHPSGLIFRELAYRVLKASARVIPELARVTETTFDHQIPPEWTLGSRQLPIHPIVAERLGLRWYRRDMRYRWDDKLLTHDEYFALILSSSYEVARAEAARFKAPVERP